MSEFTRIVDTRQLPAQALRLAADAAECAALAERFLLVAVNRLEAVVELEPDGAAVRASGRVKADVVQSCAVSGEDLAVRIDEPVELRFVPETSAWRPDEEIELEAHELDEIPFRGTQFDLGEAIAQSLALAIDPYLTGPDAERARREAGLLDPADSGPFAALKALRKD